ncbi:MAG TPA: restriction endonuclease subunit S [Pyrinomonadaceae bacterium]|nr:restriction endonuclease subunit S [Pyrinomonadaceae bacterium]
MNNHELKKGYKQTDVGIIPEDWEVRKLSEIAEIATGNTPPTNDLTNYGDEYLFVSPADIGKAKYVFDTEKKLSRKGFKLSRRFPKHSILFTCIGSTIGKSAVSLNELTSNQQINAVFPNLSYSTDFIFYNLNLLAPKIKASASEQAVPIINKSSFGETLLPLPPLPEQQAISEVLSDVDALITSLDELIAKKRNIKQGTMSLLLTGKKRLQGFHGDWETKKLGEIFEISAGGDFIPKHSSEIKDEKHQYPIYSNSIANKGLYGYSSYFVYRENALTVTARGTLGVTNFRNHKFTAIGRVLVLHPTKPLDCFFVSEFINNRIEFVIESTGVPQLTAPQIGAYEIPFPPLTEQKAIAEILSEMDSEIEALEAKRAKYQALKQGMMQELLTGKTRLV